MEHIPFNIPLVIGAENNYLNIAINKLKLCGDGEFTKSCNDWILKNTQTKKALLTTSCTHALEMAALLTGVSEGDEVIMPSFTFVSTANAFVLRGAKIVFVDIRKDTMNIDEKKIEAAITSRTKVIVPVHYGGVACEMDVIMNIAEKNNLLVVEDAAQGVMASYKGKALGSIGHLGCFSFHETKNYNCGEGGAILINDDKFIDRAEIIREKGTNRSRYLRGQVDKYSWMDKGSSYLPSELNAAFLWAQLEMAETVNKKRIALWERYFEELNNVQEIELVKVPNECRHNGHMFYVKTKNLDERQALISYLKGKNVQTAFHYVPLHSSIAGESYGRFYGEDINTTGESDKLLRLPMYFNLSFDKVEYVCAEIKNFYTK